MSNKSEVELENHVCELHKRIVRLEGIAALNRDHLERLVSLVERLLEATKEPDEEVDDRMTDIEADSNALASAGFGTDEDYGGEVERL
jgi:hypothetical protein